MALLSGCQNYIVLDSKGKIGQDEVNLILIATILMLIVVIPVIFMSVWFPLKYRASNKSAVYKPSWSHSTKIESVVWLVPIIIVTILAVITWKTTHDLDPYKPLDSKVAPIEVDAVSLDWKWLFIYPDLHIATVNELAFPVNTPLNFRITSDTVMNSLFIPEIGTQIYAMAGMQTQLHLIANKQGTFMGYSSNYSGAGFSDMKFNALSMSSDDFNAWVAKVRASSNALNPQVYEQLTKPTEKVAPIYYSSVTDGLFKQAVDKYMTTHSTDAASADAKPAADMKGMDMKGMDMKGMNMPADGSMKMGSNEGANKPSGS